MSPQGKDCKGDDVVIEATPDEFQQEYYCLKDIKSKQKPVVESESEGEEGSDGKKERKYTTFDFKAFRADMERKWND